jgi:hypothetical protein
MNRETSRFWQFLSLEIWAPAWTVCERDNRAPDVFLNITDESLGGGDRKDLLFNPVVVFAVVSALARKRPSEVFDAVSGLRELSSAKLVGYHRRPWGKAFGSVGFTDSIQDLAVSGLFRPGQRHKGKLGFHLFTDKWAPLSPDDAAH